MHDGPLATVPCARRNLADSLGSAPRLFYWQPMSRIGEQLELPARLSDEPEKRVWWRFSIQAAMQEPNWQVGADHLLGSCS